MLQMFEGLVLLGLYRGNIGIMEKNMETTIGYMGLYRDNGKYNGNYYFGCVKVVTRFKGLLQVSSGPRFECKATSMFSVSSSDEAVVSCDSLASFRYRSLDIWFDALASLKVPEPV